MKNTEMMFGKKKNGARRLVKEADVSGSQRPRGSRKGKAASAEFFRLMSLGLSSSHAPVLRRLHD